MVDASAKAAIPCPQTVRVKECFWTDLWISQSEGLYLALRRFLNLGDRRDVADSDQEKLTKETDPPWTAAATRRMLGTQSPGGYEP